MPVKRNFKRKYGGSKTSNKKTITQAVTQAVKKMVETKDITLAHNTIASLDSIPSTGGASYLFSNIVVGATSSTRVGREIDVRGIRYYLPIQSSGADTFNTVRLIMVMPIKSFPNTTTAGLFSDIFASTSWNMYFPINTNKYKVYMDKTLALRSSAYSGNSATVVPQTRVIKGFIKVNKPIKYEFDVTIASDRPTSDMILLAVSDSIAVPNPGALGGFVRIYYKDA